MLGGGGAGAKRSGGLDHDVDFKLLPGQREGVGFRQRAHLGAVDDDAFRVSRDLARKPPVDGVVLEQMRKRRGIDQIVDGDHLDVGTLLEGGAKHAPAHAAEAIDRYSYRHQNLVSLGMYSGDSEIVLMRLRPRGPQRHARSSWDRARCRGARLSARWWTRRRRMCRRRPSCPPAGTGGWRRSSDRDDRWRPASSGAGSCTYRPTRSSP